MLLSSKEPVRLASLIRNIACVSITAMHECEDIFRHTTRSEKALSLANGLVTAFTVAASSLEYYRIV